MFGTNEDLIALFARAKELEIKVILDFVGLILQRRDTRGKTESLFSLGSEPYQRSSRLVCEIRKSRGRL